MQHELPPNNLHYEINSAWEDTASWAFLTSFFKQIMSYSHIYFGTL